MTYLNTRALLPRSAFKEDRHKNRKAFFKQNVQERQSVTLLRECHDNDIWPQYEVRFRAYRSLLYSHGIVFVLDALFYSM